jgi:hypothetical protein
MNKLFLNRLASWSPGIKLFTPLNVIGVNLLLSILWDKFFILFSIFRYNKKNLLLDKSKIFELSENGYIVIENFLELRDFTELKNKIKLYQNSNNPKTSNDISYIIRTPKKNNLNLKLLENYFGKDSKLHNTIEYLTKIKSNYNAPIEYRAIINDNEQELNKYEDYQEFIHKDVFYDSFKAILYMEDTNQKNGAFQYMKGSNKFSVKSCLLNFLGGLFGIKAFSWIKLKNDEEIKSVNGQANSLIIMNAKGLHRRGIFKVKGARKTLFIDFRHFHSLFNLIPF